MKFIPLAQPFFIGKEIKYVTDCIKSTWVRSGKFVTLFEKSLAKFCNVLYASSTSNGTSALHLVLLALNIKSGDEVLVPDITYVATANTITYTGARPVFVDVDRNTWNMDAEKIEEKITKNTKAIIPVHLYGHPADMDAINKVAKKYNISVIEDACQALGALYKGKKIGSLSKAACFSFSGPKIITTGEGGMVVSNDKKLMENINAIKNDFASTKRRYYHSNIGYNYRLTNLQAALGYAQFKTMNLRVITKIRNANIYNSLLQNENVIQTQMQKSWAKSSFWLYSIVIRKNGLRDKLIEYLKKKNVETRPFFVSLHKLPMYKNKEKLLNSEYISENGISLPSSLDMTKSDIEYICSEIKKFISKNA